MFTRMREYFTSALYPPDGSKDILTQTGWNVTFKTAKYDEQLCKEFTLTYEAFSHRRWLMWTLIFNAAVFILGLHVQDSRVIALVFCLLLLALIVKINIRIHKESILVSSPIGVQVTRTFLSGYTVSQLYDSVLVQDIVINEGITIHRVIHYLTLMLGNCSTVSFTKLVPLFTNCWPSVGCLQQIFQEIKDMDIGDR